MSNIQVRKMRQFILCDGLNLQLKLIGVVPQFDYPSKFSLLVFKKLDLFFQFKSLFHYILGTTLTILWQYFKFYFCNSYKKSREWKRYNHLCIFIVPCFTVLTNVCPLYLYWHIINNLSISADNVEIFQLSLRIISSLPIRDVSVS